MTVITRSVTIGFDGSGEWQVSVLSKKSILSKILWQDVEWTSPQHGTPHNRRNR